MVATPNTEPCPRCGQPVSAGWLGGLCPRCLSRTSLSSLLAGSPVRPRLGDYELGEELGRGAMGAVYRARHATLGQEVALKVILAGEFASEAERRRFLAEAGQAARLDHPGIIRVLNYGEANGRQFYAMELVDGPTLARVASADFAGPNEIVGFALRDERAVATLLAAVARAVQHAHDRGVLHRDLKPGNILLDHAGQPHVGDFGLAKLLGDEAAVSATMTLAGSPVGTPAYMAPEQVRGERVLTTAADIWSLGAILFELLAGRPAFTAPSPAETYRRILEEEPAALPARATPRRRDLEIIARKCLRKEPVQRYASAAALAEDLESWLRGEPIQARPVSGAERVWLWARRRPVIAGLAAALGLLVLVVAIGGPVTAMRLAEARGQEQAARTEAQEKLFDALLAQARASRLTLEPGRREAGLNAVQAAAKLKVTPELRDEAVALLALPGHGVPAGFTNFIYRGRGVTLTPDFQRFVRVEADQAVTLRDRADGRELFRWPAPSTNSVAVSHMLSPDETLLAINYPESHVQVISLSRRDVILDSRATTFGAFSPDGSRFAVVQGDRGVRIHASAKGQRVAERRFDRPVRPAVAFHPGNRPVLALAAGNQLLLWHWENDTVVETFTEEAGVRGAAWQRDFLASALEDGQVRLINLRTRQRYLLAGHRRNVDYVRFSPDGRTLASVFGYDGLAHWWDTLTGTPVLRSDRFHFQQFRADGAEILLEDTVRWATAPVLRSTVYRADAVLADRPVSFSADGRWLLAGGREGFEIREVNSGRRLLAQPMADCITVQLLAGGREVLACDRTRVVRWPLRLENHRLRLETEQVLYRARARLEGATFAADGTTGAVTWGDSVELLDFRAGGKVQPLTGGSIPRTPTFSADGRWLVTGTFHGRGLQVWDLGTNFTRGPLFNTGNVSAQFSPDGRRLLAATSEGLLVFAAGSWDVLFKLPSESASGLPGQATWSANGRLLAYVRRGTEVLLLDTETWQVVLRLTSPTPSRVDGLAFGPTGEHLVVAGERRLEHWNLPGLARELAELGIPWSLPAAGVAPVPLSPEFAQAQSLPDEPALPRGLRPQLEFPARPAEATRAQVDLTAHYNARLDEDWHQTGNPGNTLGTLPGGGLEFGGVRFDVRGMVQLASAGLRSESTGYPTAVTNLAVAQNCRTLHFLGACGYAGSAEVGSPVGHYRVHYADGTVTQVPIRLGHETADWWGESDRREFPAEAHVAWRGTTPAGRAVRLFRHSWVNPRPETPVVSLDFVSAGQAPAPFLVAITAE
jgi:WD40 repeat protein